MNCSCGRFFTTPNKLIIHLEYVHKMSTYLCPVQNCKRSFQRKDSFRLHITQKHFSRHNSLKLDKCPEQSGENSSFESTKEYNKSTKENVTDSKSENLLDTIKHKINDLIVTFKRAVEIFVSKLYANISLTRSFVQNIIDMIAELFASHSMKCLMELLELCLNSINLTQELSTEINILFRLIENPFKLFNLHTEFRRITFYSSCETFIKPELYVIGQSPSNFKVNNDVLMNLKNNTSVIIPLRKTLKIFLELPKVFNKINNYIKHSDSNQSIISSLLQCSLWKSIKNNYLNKIVLPLILYYDDFQCGNPLGSHSGMHKLGALYYTIAALPPEYSSRLENIFLASLFHTADKTKYGNRLVFQPIINELISLEKEGVTVEVEGILYEVYFAVILIVGDNLGLNSVLGFVESFSANYYCRFCITHKSITCQQLKEDHLTVRVENEYNDHARDMLYGVKEDCVWNNLTNFHVYNNINCDIMHDLFEGIHRYEMAVIIENFIERNLFTLDNLNSRIKYFVYDNLDRNKPTKIKDEHIRNKCIIMSSAEMLSLVLNFRFIIGNIIPDNDPIWHFYLKLLQITEILISDSIADTVSELLENLITEHHSLYIRLFSTTLKPKHHFLLHYKNIISKVGPLSNISSIRFEGKHKDLKDSAKNVNNNINLPYTIATRLQLKVTHRMLSKVGLEDNIHIGKLEVLDNVLLQDYKNTNVITEQFLSTNSYKINGIEYKHHDVIAIGYVNEMPVFGIITNILIHKEELTCSFWYDVLHTEIFNLHFRAYEVKYANSKGHIPIENLISRTPTILHRIDNKLYVSTSKIC